MKENLFRIFDFFRLTFKHDVVLYTPFSFICDKTINAFFKILFFSLVVSYSYGNEDSVQYIVANIFLVSATTCFFGAGVTIVRERMYGTLQFIELSTISNIKVMLSKSTYHVLDGILSFVINAIFILLIFDFNFTPVQWIYLTVNCIVLALSSCAFGLALGAIGLVFRDVNFIFNLAIYIVTLLSGANFSIEAFPNFIQVLCKFIPAAHSIKGIKSILYGNTGDWIYQLLSEFSLVFIYLIIAFALYKVFSRIAVRKGTLELY